MTDVLDEVRRARTKPLTDLVLRGFHVQCSAYMEDDGGAQITVRLAKGNHPITVTKRLTYAELLTCRIDAALQTWIRDLQTAAAPEEEPA